jgi:biopolymer transport protein ExbD
MTTLTELRQRLADAQITLRTAKDVHETTRAIHEQAAIDCGDAGGKNAEERARSLTIALDQNTTYLGVLDELRDAEATVDRLKAEIAIAEDDRQLERMRIQDDANRALDRYAAALEQMAQGDLARIVIDDRAVRVARGELPF